MQELELTDRAAVERWLRGGEGRPAVVVGVDLHDHGPIDAPAGSAFLGCDLPAEVAADLRAAGSTVVEQPQGLPFREFRADVYTVPELYRGLDPAAPDSWERTPDAAAYRWFVDADTRRPRALGVRDLLAARTHDSTVEAALTRLLARHPGPAIGVMGGHVEHRGTPAYRAIVDAARTITRRGGLVVTGGGPGLMEAANLGAFLAAFPEVAAAPLVDELATATDFESPAWLATAHAVRTRLLGRFAVPVPAAGRSIGVPTWFYGQEPPNVFASHVAKMFFNSLREDGLITIADGGILFAPGKAGTVQELFADANQNWIRGDLPPTPMVLLGTRYWSGADEDGEPVQPLLERLAAERGFTGAVLVTDDVGAAVDRLRPENPRPATLAWRRSGG